MSDDKDRILHLIRTEGLKATVYVCTSCTVVSLPTTYVNFNIFQKEKEEKYQNTFFKTKTLKAVNYFELVTFNITSNLSLK